MQDLAESHWSPWDLVGRLWRHKFKAGLLFCLGIAGTVTFLGLAPRTYESHAKLFLRLGREAAALDATATTGQVVHLQESRESELYTVEEIIRSRELLEQVVDDITPQVILKKGDPSKTPAWKKTAKQWFVSLEPYNLNPLKVYDLRDVALGAIDENLSVSAGRRTNVVTISYLADDPLMARNVVQKIVDLAREEHLRVHRTNGSQEFFEKKTEELKRDLEAKNTALRDFKIESGLAALDKQRELHLTQVSTLEQNLLQTLADIASATAEVDSRRLTLATMPEMIVTEQTTGQPNAPESEMRLKVFDLETQQKRQATFLKPEDPRMQAAQQQIDESKKAVGDEGVKQQVVRALSKTRETMETALREREAQLVAFQARQASLEQKIAESKSTLNQINANEVRLSELQREIDLASANYRRYSEHLEQARIDEELKKAKISSINLMQHPTLSLTPVSPNPKLVLVGGFLCSCLLGASVMLLPDRTARRTAAIPTNSPPEPTVRNPRRRMRPRRDPDENASDLRPVPQRSRTRPEDPVEPQPTTPT